MQIPVDPRLDERQAAMKRLIELGIRGETAEFLAREFDPNEVERQIAWWPYRLGMGREPGLGLLVVAIKRDLPRPPLAPVQITAEQ